MPTPWAMPLSHPDANLEGSLGWGECGGEEASGGQGDWAPLRCSRPLGKGLARQLLPPPIPASSHPPSESWGRGSLVPRVVRARPSQEGRRGGRAGAPGSHPTVTPPHFHRTMARVGRAPGTHLVSVGFAAASLGGRTHTLTGRRARLSPKVGSQDQDCDQELGLCVTNHWDSHPRGVPGFKGD